MKNKHKFTLATNDISEIDFDTFKRNVFENYYDVDDDFVYEEFYDKFEWDIDDLRIITKKHNINIIAIADLGLWDGRKNGYKIYTNFADIFYSECEYVTWYIDSHKNLRFYGVHHDGCNHYLYRILNDISQTVLDNFEDALFYGKNIDYYIKKYTKSLGRYYLENCV